ncbi:MAG: hypothetical protein FWB74_06775, partial [Defluviitaleaceae bacterium]|nr:hypothetical protein [Defluviitaleaceae bacterium]
MKIGYYGHTQTMVIMFTHNGIYNDGTVASGIRFLENAVESSFAAGETKGFSNSTQIDCDKYRRTYHEAEIFETEDGRPYYAFNRYLGMREGVTPHNIYSNIPETNGEPLDLLYVMEFGYGGLKIPTDCRNYFWATETKLPCTEIFASIADRTFFMLDANVLRGVGAMISRQISWERTASELIRELHNNPTISYLLDAKYLFITFDCDGAVFLMKKDGVLDVAIMLTHGHSEGTVESSMQGYNLATFTLMSSYLGQFFPTILSQNMPEGEIFDIFMTAFEIATQSKAGSVSAIDVGEQLRTILEIGESFYKAGLTVSDNTSNMNVEIDIESKEWPAFPIPAEGGIVPEDWIITNGVGDNDMYDVAF